MKYSVAMKFLAIVLCAASLLGAVGSAAGLFALAQLGGKTVEAAYSDAMQDRAVAYAQYVGQDYASMELGGANRNMLNLRRGNDWQNMFFDWRRVSYVLRDAEGNPVQEQEMPGDYEVEHLLTVPASIGHYMKVLSITPAEEYDPETAVTMPDGEYRVTVAPSQPVTVIGFAAIDYSDGSLQHWNTGEKVGTLYDNGSALVLESYLMSDIPMGDGWYPCHILLEDMAGNVVYEATASDVIIMGMEQDGNLTRIHLPPGQTTEPALTGTDIIEGNYVAYDAIPAEGMSVAQISVTYGDAEHGSIASEGVSSVDLLGIIFRNADGNPEFHSTAPMMLDIPDGANIIHISFMDDRGNLIFDAECPDGVGTLSYDENGYLLFRSAIPGAEIPEETVPETTEAEPTEAPDRMDECLAVLNQDVVLYDIPNLTGNELKTLPAGKSITVLRQESAEDEVWMLTFEGWFLMEDGLLEWKSFRDLSADEAAVEPIAEEALPDVADRTAVMEQETLPEEIPEETGMEEIIPEETIAEVTEPETTAGQEMMVSAFREEEPTETEPAPVPAEDVLTMTCYDSQLQREVVAEYVLEPIPEGYTLELGLASGAMKDEIKWTLMRTAYGFRNELVKWLGICGAVMAVCMVYLCCAAGRRRGTNAVCAGGMNRIPLDLYVGSVGFALAGLAVAAVEGTSYLSGNSREIGILYMVGVLFVIALLIVGIFFAFVAQIKTPGGYWWRNTLCARCAKLAWRFSVWLMEFCEKAWKWLLPRLGRLIRGLGTVSVALWQWSRKTVLWLWDTGKRLWCWAWDMVARCWKWATKKLARFFSMLPITWQFLLTGFTLVLLLYICLRSYKVGWILMGFGVFFAAILYAASAFAILLENAKRMSKGNLDTKVDDRMLIGGFKDFAGELNALADVAVVAAQKQLKSERMKTELITNVSHDIKTPLTSIINYVDLLQKPHSEQEQEVYLEVLSRQSLRLKKLIDDLMEMSKASTGNMAVEITRMDAAETVNQALGEFADKLERAELTPVFRQPEDTVEMLADGRLVWRVMSNLLSNTVKYALPGTRVYVDLMKLDGKVIISMKNISREELNVNADELIERFVRGDASRNTEGSGLGLNIAKSLMELQKGELQVLVDGDLFKVTMIFPGV